MWGSRNADLGNRTLVFRRMDRRPFGRISGRFGIFSDSYVRYFLSDPSTYGCTFGHSPIHGKNTTQRKRNWHWSVGMLLLHGVIYGLADGVSYHYLQPCDGNWHNYWNWCIGIGTATYPGHKKMACYLRTVVLHSNFTGRIQLCPAVFLQ